MNQTQQYAFLALQLVGQAKVPADDQTLQSVLAVRGWLKSIVDGQLAVTTVPDVQPVKEAA